MAKATDQVWVEIDARLTELVNLEEDWDSYGGHPTAQSAAEEARRLLKLIENDIPTHLFDPDIMPIADGGVCVDITSETTLLSIIISPCKHLGYLVVENHKQSQPERIYSENSDVSEEKIIELVRTYFKS